MKEWLTPEEFGAHPSVQKSDQTVRRWCRDGIVRNRRVGRGYLIPSTELDRPIVLPSDPSTAPTPPKLAAVADPATPTPPSMRAAEAALAAISLPMRRVAVYGTAPCGPGEFIDEANIESWVVLPGSEKDDIIAVRAKGESMLDAGILPGDLLVVRRLKNGHNPKGGSIVLAWSNAAGGMTIKKYLTSPKRLISQNKAQPTEWLLDEGDAIMGVVIQVVRDL